MRPKTIPLKKQKGHGHPLPTPREAADRPNPPKNRRAPKTVHTLNTYMAEKTEGQQVKATGK